MTLAPCARKHTESGVLSSDIRTTILPSPGRQRTSVSCDRAIHGRGIYVSMSPGRRLRAALVSLAAIGLAVAAAPPALADSATPVTPTKLLNGNQLPCATEASASLYYNPVNSFEVEAAPTLSDG